MSKVLPVILGLAAAGVVGALAASFVLKDQGPTANVAPAPDRTDARIGELLDKVDALTRRVEVLEQTSMERAAAAAAAPPASSGNPTEDAVVNDPVIVESTLHDTVKEMVKKVQDEEREQMGQRFAARAAEREAALVKSFGEKAGLTSYQQDELTKILAKRRDAMGKFFRTMFTPGQEGQQPDMAKIREEIGNVRKETDDEIKALLSPDQYDAWTKEESSMRGPGSGFMRGMGGGGGGGGR